MFLRLSLVISLNVFTILLSAQSIQQLQNSLDSIKIEKAILQQKVEELELIEQEYSRLIEENKNNLSLLIADLKPVSDGDLVEHSYYTLSYSEENEHAIWVYYKLTREMLEGVTARTDNFKLDNLISTLSAHPDDYEGTGYDRGHLCPAGDMTINLVAMSESFYMSNMSPQVPAFNRGIWKKLEATVRNWASVEEEIHIATGPVFEDTLGTLPNCRVTVPGYYYKVVYDPTEDSKMIALVLPNARGEKHLQEYVVTVNYVESITGIDFFAALPDDIENKLEANSDASLWEFKEHQSTVSAESTTVQCNGTTLSTGQRCRNKTSNQNGFCHLHQPPSPLH